MNIVGQVERIELPERQEFEERYVEQGKPVIISNAIEDWPAMQSWDAEPLAQLLKGVRVRVKSSPRGLHPNFHASSMAEMFKTEEMPFEELITRITTGPEAERRSLMFTGDEQFVYRVRDGKSELNPDLAPLWESARLPKLVPEDRLYSVWSWFSGADVRSWLHYDNNACENLNAQIRGHKRCWLFSPEQLDKLALFPIGGKNPALNCSQIDAFNPDLERFPELQQAEAMLADVTQGDLFYIPAHWVHCFHHLGEFNANINFWWRAETLLDNPITRREAQLKNRSGAY